MPVSRNRPPNHLSDPVLHSITPWSVLPWSPSNVKCLHSLHLFIFGDLVCGLEPFSHVLGLARSQWPQGPARGIRLPLTPGQLGSSTAFRASVALCRSWLPLSNFGDHGNPPHLLLLLYIGERTYSLLSSLAPPHPGDLSPPRNYTA